MAIPAGSSVQSLPDLLQHKYVPGLTRWFNDSFPNLKYIRQNTSDLNAEGDKAIIAVETGLNEAGGTHGESADVASAVSPTTKTVSVALKQMTFRARITLKLMKKASTTTNAFARGLDLTMRSTRDAFTLTANQCSWGDGSGVFGRIKSADDAASPKVVVIDRAYGLTDGGQPFAIFRPNQTIHVLTTKGYDGNPAHDIGTFRILTVDVDADTQAATCQVTELTGDVDDLAADQYVYLQNMIAGWTDTDEDEDNSPPMGMLGFYDSALTDPLQGMAVADEPLWKPKKQPIALATVIADLNTMRTQFMKRDPLGRVAYYISSYETRNKWYNALVQKAEWRNVTRLDGGAWEVAVYDGRPWFADHTAPDARLFAVPAGDILQRFSASQFIEVVNDDNSTLHLVPNKTVYDVLFSALYEFGVKRRNVLVSGTGWT